MQTSLANNPLLPLIMGAGAVLLMAGSFTNGNLADASSVAESTATDTNAGVLDSSAGTAAGAAPTTQAPAAPVAPAAAPAAAAATSATLAVGKSAKIGGATVTLVKETPKDADVKIGKDQGTIADGKSGKVGKYTVTVTKIDKKGNVTLGVK